MTCNMQSALYEKWIPACMGSAATGAAWGIAVYVQILSVVWQTA